MNKLPRHSFTAECLPNAILSHKGSFIQKKFKGIKQPGENFNGTFHKHQDFKQTQTSYFYFPNPLTKLSSV